MKEYELYIMMNNLMTIRKCSVFFHNTKKSNSKKLSIWVDKGPE